MRIAWIASVVAVAAHSVTAGSAERPEYVSWKREVADLTGVRFAGVGS